jgi:hypothetical protein
MSRNLDELVTDTEHAEPLHPLRELVSHRFYLGGLVNTDGGLWLMLMNALLLIPLIMAAFFYPKEVLLGAAIVAVIAFAAYEAWVIWARHRART